MDGFVIYIVEEGLIEELELRVDICLWTTAIGGISTGTSGRITGVVMGRDK